MRNKRRFDRLFQFHEWWAAYVVEYGLRHCGSYEDGYYCEHTDAEHEAMRKRQDRAATQYANEVCGRIRRPLSAIFPRFS